MRGLGSLDGDGGSLRNGVGGGRQVASPAPEVEATPSRRLLLDSLRRISGCYRVHWSVPIHPRASRADPEA